MRLLILGPTWPYRGGIAQYTTELAHQLAERHTVALVSFARQYPRRLFPGRTDRDPSAWARPREAAYLLDPVGPWSWWQTARHIAAWAPDAVVAEWWVPFFAPSLAAVLGLLGRWSGARRVVECHNVLPHDMAGPLPRALTRLALAQADAFIVHAEADALHLDALGIRRAAPRHVVRLPAVALPPAPDRATARAALGLPAAAPVALFFGFVRPYKGLEVLIEAWPRLVEAQPAATLVVAGEFWTPVESFRRRAEALGIGDTVRLVDGYLPNEAVGPYFAAADVVVLPYLEASQSAVVPLASRHGVPVVASRVGGLPDVVQDGFTGLLVPPGDPAALAGALRRFFTEPGLAARLAAGTRAAEPGFSWSGVVQTVERATRSGGVPLPVPVG
jgi:glycosyltransferase involved in cell wall biosynthesis